MTQATVHSASVGPMRICAWPAVAQMLSVMTPVKVCVLWAADNPASARTPTRRGFISVPES